MSTSFKSANDKHSVPRDRKVSARLASGGCLGASAYNPSLGTFHALENLSLDSEAGFVNGRPKSVDEMDDTASSHGGGLDNDCLSINGSCSGDSEDQPHASSKDNLSLAKSGCSSSDRKRDKIRGKNERKHRRQKERRAQELREKCNGYLMSRKLECLSQKLIAMGFSNERAMMALIINNGHVEQSVAWLLEGGEGQLNKDWCPSGNLKLDISEELDKLHEIERKYQFSRPDIERAVVSCDGDLEKALDLLQAHNLSAGPKEELIMESEVTEPNQSSSPPVLFTSPVACQSKISCATQPRFQARSSEISAPACGRGLVSDSPLQLKVEVLKTSVPMQRNEPQSLVIASERRTTSQSNPVTICTAASSFIPVASAESGLVFGFGTPNPRLFSNSAKNTPVKECTRRQGGLHWQLNSQSISSPESVPSTMSSAFPSQVISTSESTPSAIANGFSSSSLTRKGLVEVSSPSSVLHVHDDMRMKGLTTYKSSFEGLELGSGELAGRIKSLLATQMESQGPSWNRTGRGSCNVVSPLSSPLSATQSEGSLGSSCGLFTGWGGVGQSAVDWNNGAFRNYDYRNIDWSMNVVPQTSSQGSASNNHSATPQMKWGYQWDFEGSRRFQTSGRAMSFVPERTTSGSLGAKIQDNISMDFRHTGSQDWTSPFAGKDLFNLPPSFSSLFL